MSLFAGVAVRDISPNKQVFLVGYPHVPRTSTGIHDPLWATALYLTNGTSALLTIAVDVLFVSAESTRLCRQAISQATSLPESNILISATHTHSGPVTNAMLAWRSDPVVPPPDPQFMEKFHRQIIEAGSAACVGAEPARLAVTSATAQDCGGNRTDPGGPFDAEIALLVIRRRCDQSLLALQVIYGMHPTVLHEDSRMVSADFPHFVRLHLAEAFPQLTTVYQTGPCGNLSPRYHVRAQTFAEAERLGRKLGESVLQAVEALADADFRDNPTLRAARGEAELIPRAFPPVALAETSLGRARDRYQRLEREKAPHGKLRTAECAVFGCEEALTLARAQDSGELARCQAEYCRAELVVFRIGDLFVAGLPGEVFVEYGLEIKRRAPRRAFVVSLANGELQGYIATPEATGYEAAFALFRPESGARIVDTALHLMQELL